MKQGFYGFEDLDKKSFGQEAESAKLFYAKDQAEKSKGDAALEALAEWAESLPDFLLQGQVD